MNRKQVIEMLLSVLGSFRLSERFTKELIEIITGSGYEERFLKLLIARLTTLTYNGVNAIRYKEFERINEVIFSMHISSRGFNIRVLYSFLKNGDPVLLLPFYEREGKKKTDYSTFIDPAENRLSAFIKEQEHE